MYETFPKGKGNPPSSGNLGRKAKEQETGDVYRFRQSITAGEETRYRELGPNDYGKKPQPEKDRKGIPVNPRRTIISIG